MTPRKNGPMFAGGWRIGGCEGEPLLHPQGIGLEPVLRAVGQAHQIQALLDPRLTDALDAGGNAQVVAAAEVRVEVGRLKGGADPGTCGDEIPGLGCAEEPEAPARRVDDAHEHPDGGGLAAPVGAQEAEDLALLDGDGDLVHRKHRVGATGAVALGELERFDDGHRITIHSGPLANNRAGRGVHQREVDVPGVPLSCPGPHYG